MQIRYKKIKLTADNQLFEALSKIISQRQNPAILGANYSSRFSYWCYDADETFEFYADQKEPLDKLIEIIKPFIEKDKNLPDGIFVGGWLGFLGYELGAFIEDIKYQANDDLGLPIIRLSLYSKVIAYDSKNKAIYLFGKSDSQLNELESIIKSTQKQSEVIPCNKKDDNIDVEQLKCNMSFNQYKSAFERIKKHIYDGDVYQINFSQRFEHKFFGMAIDVFNWHNKHNPCPYAAFIDCGEFQIVSSSPELFIEKIANTIITKPIKGTRPLKQHDKTFNDRNFIELCQSEKDQAELNMIIDLERNDLGKICKAGTIKVIQQRTIEKYPTVFHGVATIAGTLKDNISICDILRAMFPGGSITGAPKVSAMEIIANLEPTARSVYTGSVGFIGLDGSICLNIAIRTLIIQNSVAYMQTGGGIVADSDLQQEWQETITKAQAMANSIMYS